MPLVHLLDFASQKVPMRSLYIILTLLFALTLRGVLNAQPAVVLHDTLKSKPLAREMLYFQDPQGKYSIEEVSSPAFADSFKLLNKQVPNFGFLEVPYWFKFRVHHQPSSPHSYFFEVAYPPLDSLTFYHKTDSGYWEGQLTGDQLPFSQRYGNYVHYLFPIPPHPEPQDYFFKVDTRGALTMPVYIKEAMQLQEDISSNYLRFGLFYGALIMIFLYNLFLYAGLRLKPYLFYCLYIFFSVLSQSFLYGHAHQYLWPSGGNIINLLTGFTLYLSTGFALLFTINFVQTKRFVPKLHRPLIYYTGAIFFLSVLLFFGPYSLILALIPGVYIITVMLIIVAAAIAWYRKLQTAKLFLLAWVVYLIGLVVYSLQSLGIFGSVETASSMVMTGSVIEALLLSLALAERIRQFRIDRQKASQQLLVAYQEKHEVMEQRVSERTQKLQEKQKEVIRQNRQLFEQQQLIEQQNQQLSLLNENLEKIVSSRTGELRKANLTLHKRNQQLEQFAYIISHNLRGPVASIIGLIKLFDREKLEGQENLQYLDYLYQSAIKLDAVISDLGQVLSLEQNLDKHLRDIHLPTVVEGILEKLHLQIKEANPLLETDYQEENIYSHPAYLESIMYNLISNAIKYRDEEKQTLIEIKTRKESEVFYISVSDNGLGIDMDQYGNRLFSLYQRFHINKEGKGLGLYMVKRQVEAMGGSIVAESRPGEGTTFTLSLPQHKD